MTRKQRRLTFILSGISTLLVAVLLVMFAMQDSIVFFHSPSEVVAKHITVGQRIRIGGLVAEGSEEREGETVKFAVTDMAETVSVEYTGILPDLFREGQGIVVEGALTDEGIFVAETVYAKHDENYMPPEAAAALKEAGLWQEDQTSTVSGAN
jgi:cytochrome c-type biogenesis protein CcmE